MKVKNKKGFSLVEVLVVVLIIGVLSGIAIPLYSRAILRSRAAEVNNLLSMVRTRQTKKFAEEKQYASVFTDPALSKITSAEDSSYESNSGTEKRVNDNYLLELKTNSARNKGCVIGSYLQNGEKRFTFAISYTKAGLGCTDAPGSIYSVCRSFGDTVVGSVNDVCSVHQAVIPDTPPTPPITCAEEKCAPGTQFINCKCVPCDQLPDPGYDFAPAGCEWKPCAPCEEGYHFVERCKCEQDSTSCDECPGGKILINNETCECACPKELPIWDEKEKKCVACKEPTVWNPKKKECACPDDKPIYIEHPKTHEGKCVTCENVKPNSVWNPKTQTCDCECTGGRIAVQKLTTDGKQEDKENKTLNKEKKPVISGFLGDITEESCECVCPSQMPLWDEKSEQCVPCSGLTPFYDEAQKKCVSCYEKYGADTPVWDEEKKMCVSCYNKYPGRVACSNAGSSINPIIPNKPDDYNTLTDYGYGSGITSINSYAAKTGALLATSSGGLCGEKNASAEIHHYVGTPQCTASGQHTPCQYTCISLGLSTAEGLIDSCGANLQNGGIGDCTCDPGVGWICPNQCEVINGEYWTVEIPTQECEMAPTFGCTPDLSGWTIQGSCYDTWHNAVEYEPAKPVWVPSHNKAGGYCASCGQVSVSNCSSSSTCGGTTHDHFSGSVWDGEKCVVLNNNYYLEDQSCVSINVVPTVKCYSHTKSCSPACYWNRDYANTNYICPIGGQNYQIQKREAAAADVRNMLTSSSSTTITQVYRQAYNKDYYALKELDILPSLKGNVITK